MVVEQVQLLEVLGNHALVDTMVVDTVLVAEEDQKEEGEYCLTFGSKSVVPY